MGDGEAVAVKVDRHIAVVGDSIVGSRDGYYTQKLNEYLHGMHFHQFGKTDDTTFGMKGRLPAILSARKYDELIIAGGVNDVSSFGGGSEQNWRKNFAAMERNIREMIAIAQRHGVERILLLEVAPWGGSDKWDVRKGERSLEYNAMLERVAAEVNAKGEVCVQAIRLQKNMEDPENPGKLREEFTGMRRDGGRDWLHPGEAGLIMIGKSIAEGAYASSLWPAIMSGEYKPAFEELKALGEKKTGRIAAR